MILGRAEEGELLMSLRDWRKAVRVPPSYRVGKNVNRTKMQLLVVLGSTCALLLIYFYNSDSEEIGADSRKLTESTAGPETCQKLWKYNSTYPITKATKVHDNIIFKIGLISDMDHSSRSKIESNTWLSYYLQGTLKWNPSAQKISIEFDKNNFKTLKTKFSHNGRGMELSELVTFDGKLLTICDRTGILYVIDDVAVYPWLLLLDGNGKTTKGFKAEWLTVKDEHLYVGSMGKEWTTPSGEFVNTDPMYVKRISPTGVIENLDWAKNYEAIRASVGIHFPGYMLHESAVWSEIHKKWFFLPRRASKEVYNEETDETTGTNLLFIADENFKSVEAIQVGEIIPTHGFSAFRFIPGTHDEVIVALKTVEHLGKVATYIMAFTVQGRILLGETKVDDLKYEGLDFI